MGILYNTAIFFYRNAIIISSLVNPKARKWLRGRRNIFDEIRNRIKQDDKIVWFHCASSGEFEQGKPVMEQLKNENSELKILLTVFSPSGYETAKNYKYADYLFYLPIDTKRNAKQFIDIVKPKMSVFVKYEFWLNYINTLSRLEIPVFLISAIFRKDQIFFRRYGGLFRKALQQYSGIFVQDETSAKLLDEIGLKNYHITGDTRFDRVTAISQNPANIEKVKKFCQGKKVLIAGSTWFEDEILITKHINQSGSDLKYMIVPHEIQNGKIEKLICGIARKCIRFSKAETNTVEEADVMIIDSMGMLSMLYQYGSIAYIGGGFGKGIHNTLEAAVYGMPVIFGPNYHKFKEARELIERGGAFSIANYGEFKRTVNMLLADEFVLKIASEMSRNYVSSNKGATAKIISVINRRRAVHSSLLF